MKMKTSFEVSLGDARLWMKQCFDTDFEKAEIFLKKDWRQHAKMLWI